MAGSVGDIIISVALDAAQALTGFTQLRASTEQATQEMANSVRKAESYFDNIGTSAKTQGASIKTAFSNGLEGVANKVKSIGDSFQGLNGVMSSVMGTIGLGSFKSLTVDLAMSRQQMTSLMSATMGSTSEATKFVDTMRQGTSTSPVMLRQMIEAMNGIKLSTGMSNQELVGLNDTIRKVGEASVLMGDDTEHATFVMKEAMSGLNGDFQVLKEQFGITKDKMLATGLWSGAADDVDGYRAALDECMKAMGDFNGVMDTTPGKISQIKSAFSSAGLKIGEELLKPIDWVASAFLDANKNGSVLANGILMIGGAASVFATLAPTLSSFIDTLDSVKNGIGQAKDAMDLLRNAGKLQETAFTALSGAAEFFGMTELSNVFSLGAHATASEVDAGANITLAGALHAAASGAWTLTVALLSNPWTWVIIGVVAVVAILVYLYQTNEDVRNSLNQVADTIKGGLMQAWDALVNVATQVWNGMQKLGQIIYGMLVPAWNELKVQLAPLGSALMSLYDTFVSLWATLTGGSESVNGVAGNFDYIGTLAKVLGALILGLAQTVILIAQTVLAVVIPVITFIVNQLSTFIKVINAVVGVIDNLISGNISLGDALGALGEIILTAGREISENMLQLVTDIVNNLGGVFNSLPTVVQEELGNIAQAILNSNPILAAIVGLATQVVDFFKSALGIASPGFMAQAISDEMNNIAQFITGAVGSIVNAVVTLGTNIWNGFVNALSGVGNWIIQSLSNIPTQISTIFQQFILSIQIKLQQARIIVQMLMTQLRSRILNPIMQIPARVRMYFQQVVNGIRQRLVQARTVAGTLVNQLRTRIVTVIQQIPARVRAFFQQVVNNIRSNMVSAVNNARSQAVEIYNNILNKIREIPGQVGNEIGKLGGIIKDKLVQAAKNAFSGAASIVSNFLSGLDRHSPGKIQRETEAEFTSLPNIIMDSGVQAAVEAENSAVNIVKSFEEGLGDGLNIPSMNYLGDAINPEALSLPVDFIPNGLYSDELITSNVNLDVLNRNVGDESRSAKNIVSTVRTNNAHSEKTLIIEEINLDCNNLTTAQCKKVVWQAIQGVYDGM